jgi:hypothetical protein
LAYTSIQLETLKSRASSFLTLTLQNHLIVAEEKLLQLAADLKGVAETVLERFLADV